MSCRRRCAPPRPRPATVVAVTPLDGMPTRWLRLVLPVNDAQLGGRFHRWRRRLRSIWAGAEGTGGAATKLGVREVGLGADPLHQALRPGIANATSPAPRPKPPVRRDSLGLVVLDGTQVDPTPLLDPTCVR